MDRKLGMIRISLGMALVAATASYVAGQSCAAQHQHSMTPTAAQPQPVAKPQPAPKPQSVQPSQPTVDAKQLVAIQEALTRAIGHIEAGQQQNALQELRQIQASLESLRQAIVKSTPSPFVNDHCPIMGTAIDPAKVPTNLTRLYGSGKVAFCCSGCPQTWDRLVNSEKAAKLAGVTARAQ